MQTTGFAPRATRDGKRIRRPEHATTLLLDLTHLAYGVSPDNCVEWICKCVTNVEKEQNDHLEKAKPGARDRRAGVILYAVCLG